MKIVFRLIDGAVIAAGACAFGIFHLFPGFRGLIPVIVLLFLAVNIIPSPTDFTYKRKNPDLHTAPSNQVFKPN